MFQAYVSMLYLRKFSNFKIILRGKPVDQYNIADDLIHSKVIPYRPVLAIASNEVGSMIWSRNSKLVKAIWHHHETCYIFLTVEIYLN